MSSAPTGIDQTGLPRPARSVALPRLPRALSISGLSGQVLVVFDDRYYGARGAVVNDVGGPLEDDRQYQRALRSCGG